MVRFFAGAGSAALLMVAGFFLWQGMAQEETVSVPEAPPAQAHVLASLAPPTPPAADEPSREEKRFRRADKDDDGRIALDELYQPRRKTFAKLDANGNGSLDFEEWAVRTRTKFEDADADRDGILTRPEYAATAPKPKPRPECSC